MELYAILVCFIVLLAAIIVIYVIYTKYIKKQSSNNSNSIFAPKHMFNYHPELINAYLNENMDLNDLNRYKNGFKATFLDLINKNYIIYLNPDPNSTENNHSKGPFMQINKKKSIKALKEYEMDLIHYLKLYDKKGSISLHFIKDDLDNLKASKKFHSKYVGWEKHLNKDYLNNKFFSGDLKEFKKEINEFKSYTCGHDLANADISSGDINKFLVYGMALEIEKKMMNNFENHLDEKTLEESEIYHLIKVNGLDFVEKGIQGTYLIKSGDHDPNTNVYGY